MCRKSMVYYDSEVDQDVQDLFCTGINSQEPVMTHWALHWTEIADSNSRHEGDDYVPETCPLLKADNPDEPSREPDCNPNHEPDDEPINRYSVFYRLKIDSLKSE